MANNDRYWPANVVRIMDTAAAEGQPAAAETMAASQRRPQPISVALGDDIE